MCAGRSRGVVCVSQLGQAIVGSVIPPCVAACFSAIDMLW